MKRERERKIYYAYIYRTSPSRRYRKFDPGYKTVQRILNQKRRAGTLSNKHLRGFMKQAQVVQELVDVDATITLKQIQMRTRYLVSS